MRVITIIFVLSAFLYACDGAIRKQPGHIYTLSEYEKSLLREGDILLRHGYGFVSNSIVKVLSEEVPVSHSGLLVQDPNGEFQVIHSVSQSVSDSDGVQMVDLDTFVRDSQPNSLVVVRFRGLANSPPYSQQISERAFYYLDRQIPFDYSFDFNDTTRFFCSEFIARVLSDIFGAHVLEQMYPTGISVLERLKFEVFFRPDMFDLVLNHQDTHKESN